KRCCRSSEVKQFTADHFHLLPYGRSLARFGYRMNPALRWKFREPIQSAPRDLCGAHGENRILQGIQTACHPLLPKIRIALDNSANRKYVACTLSPPEGRFAIVTTRWARDAMDAVASGEALHRTKTFAAYGEVVWSWRRDPGATLAGS